MRRSGSGRILGRLRLTALMVMATVGCSTRNLGYLRAGHDGAAPTPSGDAGPGASAPEVHGEELGPPDAAPTDWPGASADADPTNDSGPGVPGPLPRLVLESGPGTRQYGGSGGNASSATCGPDEVLVGYLGNASTSALSTPVVSRLEGRCGRLAVMASAPDGSPPYRVTVTAAGGLPPVGGGNANAFTALCPADQVLVGFFGRDGIVVDQVGFRCAPLLIELGAAGVAHVLLGPITTRGPWPTTRGGSEFAESCPASGVASGHAVGSSNLVDRLGLRCTEVRVERL